MNRLQELAGIKEGAPINFESGKKYKINLPKSKICDIMNKEGFKTESSNITDKDPEKFIEEYIQYLIVELPKGLNEKDTNLLNIRDEMLGELQKLKYLLTLK